jgi:hypothetical protein
LSLCKPFVFDSGSNSEAKTCEKSNKCDLVKVLKEKYAVQTEATLKKLFQHSGDESGDEKAVLHEGPLEVEEPGKGRYFS